MTIRFACRCGKKMKTSDDKIGKKVLCSACGSPVVVPSSDTAAVEKVAAPIAAADTASALLRGAATKATTKQQQEKPRKTMAFDDPSMDAPGYDTTATAKYFTMTFLLPGGIVLLFCGLVYGISSWISGASPKHPELTDVSGVIKLDGEALSGARIILRPKTEDGAEPKASASIGRTDKDGSFRMEYARDSAGRPIYGAPLGPCTVQISAADVTGREVTPIRFRDRSETRVIEKGSNKFEFLLESARQ